MNKTLLPLVAGAALACATSAWADGWKFTITESVFGPPGTCNAPVVVPCTVTKDPNVPYVLGTLTVAPGATRIAFFRELTGRVDDDNHTLLSFVPNSNFPLQQFDITNDVPPDWPLEINIELNVTPPKHALTGTIDISYQARMFGILSMRGYNNLWVGEWITRQDLNVHQFVARSEWIP